MDKKRSLSLAARWARILSFSLVFMLVLGCVMLPASANGTIHKGKPIKDAWAVFGEDTSYLDTKNGTEVTFGEGVNLNQRLAFKHNVDLDGFGIKLSNVVVQQGDNKKLPVIFGNDNIFTWHDRLSVAFVFDLTLGEVMVQRNNGDYTSTYLGTLSGFNFNSVNYLDIDFNKIDSNSWSITVNGITKTFSSGWIVNTVANVSSAGFGIGGDWLSGDNPVSYTVEELRARNALNYTYVMYSGLPVENAWTSVSSTGNGYYIDRKDGAQLAFDLGVMQDDRMGFNYNVDLDGFGFVLEDLDYIAGTDKRLPFNIGNAGNQSWHTAKSIQFILLIDSGTLAIQPEHKNAGSGLERLSIGGFNTYGATSIEISFNKVNASTWSITINGVTKEISAAYINEQISNPARAGFALGGAWYSENAPFSYIVTEMYAKNANEFTYQQSGPEIYRGRPAKGAWDLFGGNASYADTQNGTEVVFTQGVDMNQRLGFRHNFGLDGFGIKLSNITAPQNGKIIPFILGNNGTLTWYDKASVALLFDLSGNRVIFHRFNGDSSSESLGIVEGYTLSGVSTLDISFQRVDANNWSLIVNGVSKNIPSSWITGSINNTQAASLAIGGDWNSGGGAISYTVSEMYGRDAESFVFASYVDLIKDPTFEDGFLLGNVTDGISADPNDTINFKNPGSTVFPTWEVAQWYSNYDIRDVIPVKEGNSYVFRNPGKVVTARDNSFTLELFGNTEYGGEGWPHLIMSQDFASLPKLSDIDQARLKFNVRTHYLENYMTSEDPTKNTSLLTISFVIQDRNINSTGFGDYYWLQLPLFDNRTNSFGGWEGLDNGGKEIVTNKYMVSAPGASYYNGTFDLGKTIKIDADVYGLMTSGYYKTVAAGYLQNSDFEDMTIAGITCGWEMMGAYNSSATISALSLDIHYTD